ncbi:MAG TPA: guanitoxin biosynthesis heme-dependent pre-guanitoxin N-hydroxylase GntA [Flavobacterium sp.]|jgi:hypothetical protein|nr:guanitoxin biosynthesis heme-dependent pre-guanitoxin N-hydroxylase GntA [Flavobacterium sp.]
MQSEQKTIDSWKAHIEAREFPCVAAKAAMQKDQQRIFIAGHLACPKDDKLILDFIYNFVDEFRASETMFHSAVILFEQPTVHSEEAYSKMFWQRLQALSDMDSQFHQYDSRVSDDPESENFSFSLKGEAFFIIGLHPASSRPARRFKYPAIVFNPHIQFEQLRTANQYGKMKKIIRKKDVELSGSVNPMLEDFGSASETFQYTGQKLNKAWKCPLHILHGTNENHKSA